MVNRNDDGEAAATNQEGEVIFVLEFIQLGSGRPIEQMDLLVFFKL